MNKLRVLDLFSGIGGFSLGLDRTGGFETVAFCEIEEFPQKVLMKHWPGVPIFEDVCELKGEDVGPVEVICGGFPCQDVSVSGAKAGIGEGSRTGLFHHMLRIATEMEAPPYIIFENVGGFLSGPTDNPGEWFGNFLRELAKIGYDAEWFCLSASSIGAPHQRERVWIVAYPDTAQCERGGISRRVYEEHAYFSDARWGQDKPGVERASDGVPDQMDRLASLGNAVVPQIPEMIGHAILETYK
jgi:DNA (cytosine-5)-methyltransferase 1